MRPDLLEEAKRLSKALPVVGSIEPGESSLARARVVMAELVERLEQAERLERCNQKSPEHKGEWFLCDLFPDHDGPHVNAEGFQWRAEALAAQQREVEGG